MKVKKLRDVLERALNQLEDYNDNEEVKMVTNTYFLGDCFYFLGVSGYDGGYINLDRIKIKEREEEYED